MWADQSEIGRQGESFQGTTTTQKWARVAMMNLLDCEQRTYWYYNSCDDEKRKKHKTKCAEVRN